MPNTKIPSQHSGNPRSIGTVAVIALLFFGCSHNIPLAPELNQHDPPRTPLTDNHQSWGHWYISIDLGNLNVDLAPARSSEVHLNVTDFIAPPVCPSCLNIGNVNWAGQNLLSVTVELTHPFPGKPNLDAFDVRGIVLGPPESAFQSGTVSLILDKPDGYTSRFTENPRADINPYLDFATDDPERRFGAGTSHSREYLVRTQGTGSLNFDYAIDACWLPPGMVDPEIPALSPHCNEAWRIDADISGPITGHPNSFASIECTLSDWQNDSDNATVTLEAPDLVADTINLDLISGGEHPVFKCSLQNSLDAPPGTYYCLLRVQDQLNKPLTSNLVNFQLLEIIVSDETPSVVGLSIEPKIAALGNQDSQHQFKAVGHCQDGSLAFLQNSIDWSCAGTDLNGNPLAEINQSGLATRLSPKWWGGTASVHAVYQEHHADATIYCMDPFADAADVDFGVLVDEGSPFAKPENLLGPPTGEGPTAGTLEVCSLGYGGVATLEFVNNIIIDGPGPDLIVFENAFYFGGCDWSGQWQHATWNETALVEASQDGIEWFRFPSDYNPNNITCGIEPFANTSSFSGIAGVHAAYAHINPDGTLEAGIDPTDPETAGGDSFDLADIGLEYCRFIRLIDTGDRDDAPGTEQYDSDGDLINDLGKVSIGGVNGMAGFDGDSVAAIHSASPLTIK